MKKYQFKIRGRDYSVEIQKTDGNIIDIEVNGSKYSVELERTIEMKKTPKLMRPGVPAPKSHEKKIKKSISSRIPVKAPLPGIILKIIVKVGDVVKEGDTLLVMEAMKMENNIQSEKSGTISDIKINEGDTVLQDDILIEMS